MKYQEGPHENWDKLAGTNRELSCVKGQKQMEQLDSSAGLLM